MCVCMLGVYKTKLAKGTDCIFESSLREERFKFIRIKGGTGNMHSCLVSF